MLSPSLLPVRNSKLGGHLSRNGTGYGSGCYCRLCMCALHLQYQLLLLLIQTKQDVPFVPADKKVSGEVSWEQNKLLQL